MEKKSLIAAAIATVVMGATAGPLVAQSAGDRAEQSHAQHAGERRGGDRRGHDNRRGRGDRMAALFENYDTNEDGDITQAEIDAVRAGRLAEFDADGDSQLTLEEYQALWLDAMHERMVDRFQRHDDDGDGLVTVEEFGEDFANIVDRRDRNDDGVLNADDRGRRQAPATDAE